jgi:hypothetical protein
MLDEDYEGAAEIERAWREGMTPDLNRPGF